MNKILTLSLLLVLSVSFVSAKYDFEYAKPSIDIFTYPVFLMSQTLGSTHEYVTMIYRLLTTSRFYEEQLFNCEAELKRKIKTCGSGSNTYQAPKPQQVIPENESHYIHTMGDGNCDGVVSASDRFSVVQYFGSVYDGTEDCPFGDLNNDGVVSAGDHATFQIYFGNN